MAKQRKKKSKLREARPPEPTPWDKLRAARLAVARLQAEKKAEEAKPAGPDAKSRWKSAFRATRLQNRTEHALDDRIHGIADLEREAGDVLAQCRRLTKRGASRDDAAVKHHVRQLLTRATAAREEAVRRQESPRARWMCAGVEQHVKDAVQLLEIRSGGR